MPNSQRKAGACSRQNPAEPPTPSAAPRHHLPKSLSSRLSAAHGGIYALPKPFSSNRCVDPSTRSIPLRCIPLARDDRLGGRMGTAERMGNGLPRHASAAHPNDRVLWQTGTPTGFPVGVNHSQYLIITFYQSAQLLQSFAISFTNAAMVSNCLSFSRFRPLIISFKRAGLVESMSKNSLGVMFRYSQI